MNSNSGPNPQTNGPTKVLRVLWSLNRGGAEVRAVDVVRQLDRDQVAVDFVALSGKPSELDDVVRELGATIHYLSVRKTFPLDFLKILRQERPDCVHCQLTLFSGIVMFLTWLAGVRERVTSYHNMGLSARPSRFRILYAGLMKFLVRRFATKIVAVSEGTLDHCYGPTWRNNSHCEIVYQGFPQKLSSASELSSLRNRLGLPQGEPVLINVGNFRSVKNQQRTLEIFAKLREEFSAGQLLVAGGTHNYAESVTNLAAFEARVEELGLQDSVHILGNRNDVPQLLQLADLLLFTSISEGCANVIWESIAQGTPVLTNELPIVTELKKYMSGVVECSLNEFDEVWTQLAASILQDRSDAEARRKRQREFAAGPLNVERTAAKYQDVWSGRTVSEPMKRAA